MTRTRPACSPLVRAGAVLGCAAVLCLVPAAPAAAHVGITPSTTEAGSTAELVLAVPHGCDGSATTELSVQVPTGVLGVVPTRTALWDVETEVAEFTQPVTDAHGNEITERVASITWTAREPLPDGIGDALSMTLQLPEEPGTQLWFPIVQRCEDGEAAWIEVAQDGQDEAALEMPAPTFVTTEASTGGHGGHGGHDADPSAEPASDARPTDDASAATPTSGPVLGVSGLVLGLLGAVLGGTALLRQRRAG